MVALHALNSSLLAAAGHTHWAKSGYVQAVEVTWSAYGDNFL